MIKPIGPRMKLLKILNELKTQVTVIDEDDDDSVTEVVNTLLLYVTQSDKTGLINSCLNFELIFSLLNFITNFLNKASGLKLHYLCRKS